MVNDTDTMVASRAVVALARVGGVESIRPVLSDQRDEIRIAAVNEFGQNADASRLPTPGRNGARPRPRSARRRTPRHYQRQRFLGL